MYPKTHLIFGLIFAGLIWLFFPPIGFLGFFLILVSSVLIDVDHYLFYVWKVKDWSLIRAYRWSIKVDKILLTLKREEIQEYKSFIFIFHGIEFWLILLFLIPLSNTFVFILLGIAIHMVLDFIDLFQRNVPLTLKLSQVYNLIKNKNKLDLNKLSLN